jgi:RNA recognition motif-containing protein
MMKFLSFVFTISRTRFPPERREKPYQIASVAKDSHSMKLYVGNLSYSVNDNSLRSIFEAYGAVESARVISDRDTGQSKGFGFVEMSDADGQKAMGALNGQELEGRGLRVNEARPQEPRTGGGGGSRDRY